MKNNAHTQEEQTTFAYTEREFLTKNFIASQHISTDKNESFFIEFEGTSIQALHKKEIKAVQLFLNGELKETINENQRYTTTFQTNSGNHTITIWLAKASFFFFNNFFRKKGVAITIDNIPVKGTLADPLTLLAEGKAGIWFFIIVLILSVILALTGVAFLKEYLPENDNLAYSLLIYTLALLLMIYAERNFDARPQTALRIALVIGVLNTIDYLFGFLFGKIIYWILGLAFRIAALAGIWRSLKNLTRLIGEEPQPLKDKLSDILLAFKQKSKWISGGIAVLVILMLVKSLPNPLAWLEKEELLPFEKDGKWGYVNQKGKIVIEPQFIEAKPFDGDYAIVLPYYTVAKNESDILKRHYFSKYWGEVEELIKNEVIDEQTRVLIKNTFLRARDTVSFRMELETILPNADKETNFFLKRLYQSLQKYNLRDFDLPDFETFVNDMNNDKIYQLYKNIKQKYKYLSYEDFKFYTENSRGLIQELVRLRFFTIDDLDGDESLLWYYNLMRQKKFMGNYVQFIQYLLSSENNRRYVYEYFKSIGFERSFEDICYSIGITNESYTIIDKNGKWVMTSVYDHIVSLGENWFKCSMRYEDTTKFENFLRYNLLNLESKYIRVGNKVEIMEHISSLGGFSEGIAGAKDKHTEKWGYIDNNGKWRIEPKYDGVHEFSDGLACVKVGYTFGYIDKGGKFVIAPILVSENTFSDEVCYVKTLEIDTMKYKELRENFQGFNINELDSVFFER